MSDINKIEETLANLISDAPQSVRQQLATGGMKSLKEKGRIHGDFLKGCGVSFKAHQESITAIKNYTLDNWAVLTTPLEDFSTFGYGASGAKYSKDIYQRVVSEHQEEYLSDILRQFNAGDEFNAIDKLNQPKDNAPSYFACAALLSAMSLSFDRKTEKPQDVLISHAQEVIRLRKEAEAEAFEECEEIEQAA